MLHKRLELELQIKIGSLYPTIVNSADGESTANVYLRSEYVSNLEKGLMPYLAERVDNKPNENTGTNLAEEWLRLFGKETENIDEDNNE